MLFHFLAAAALASAKKISRGITPLGAIQPHTQELPKQKVRVDPVIDFGSIQGYDQTAPEYQAWLQEESRVKSARSALLQRASEDAEAFVDLGSSLSRKKKKSPPADCTGKYIYLQACIPCGKITIEWEQLTPPKNGGKPCTTIHPDTGKEVVLNPGNRFEVACDCDCEGWWELGICKDCLNREDTFHVTRPLKGKGKKCPVANGGTRMQDCECKDCEGDFKPVRNVECVDCGTQYEYRVVQQKTGGGADCKFNDGFRKTDCDGVWEDQQPGFKCKPENNCGQQAVDFIVRTEADGGKCVQKGTQREAECSEKNFSCNVDCAGFWEYEDECNNECKKSVKKRWVEQTQARGTGKKCPFRRNQKMTERCKCEVDCVGEFVEKTPCDCPGGVTESVRVFEIMTEKGGTGADCPTAAGTEEKTDCECPPAAPMMEGRSVHAGAAVALAAVTAGFAI